MQQSRAVGRVYLAGAGPGDPGLLTLRCVEVLRRADAVLYDYLVNPRILVHAPPAAERVCLGRHGHGRLWTQDEINRQMIALANSGQTVVRLKAGDPAVFARMAEETAALEAAGVPYEIVPGITAALAAGSHAGIPITHRDHASAVALVTGQETQGKAQPAIDFRALANFPGTIVFYMGVTSVETWSAALLAGGRSAGTPVALVRRCSWHDQTIVRSTLGEVARLVADLKLRPPVISIVGEVAAAQETPNWFTARPLYGVSVLVPRPEHQARSLADRLSELGAQVLIEPAIEIAPADDWNPVDAAITRLHEFDWVVFSSVNGVEHFLARLTAVGGDARRFGHARLAAIGTGTADELARHHLRADLVPEKFRAEALAEELSRDAAGKRFLLVRASRGRDVLAETLRAAGAMVDQVVAYISRDVTRCDEGVAEAVRGGRVKWVAVTSSAIARSLARLFGKSLKNCRLASISPVTSATLTELGFAVSAEAASYTMEGLVAAILAESAKSRPHTFQSPHEPNDR